MVKTRVRLNTALLRKRMLNRATRIQTDRLVRYAEQEIVQLVETHEFKNRTLNLQDSYLWVVYYNGKRVKSGYYGNKKAKSKSVLHEWSPEISVDVNGRELARKFISTYKPTETNGWEIVFAAAAPYGAYIEGGFTLKGRIYQFDVMSQRYDHIKNALTPLCRVHMEIHQPQY